MEHPENSSEYVGLQVNSGVEQPSIINPYLSRNRFRRRELTAAEMVEGILKGDVTVLSQAVRLDLCMYSRLTMACRLFLMR